MELLTAGELLNKALGGIVAAGAGGGAKVLWQRMRDRLSQNQSLEAEILELEQNPTQENLKPLEPFLHVAMHQDPEFAKEIRKLAREIADSGDKIEMKNFETKDNSVAIGKAEGNQFIGGTHYHGKK
ncbi:MAG: hypothetical protein AAGA80_28760 [Cyanobacteria bacterium P01_F01_bin.143]